MPGVSINSVPDDGIREKINRASRGSGTQAASLLPRAPRATPRPDNIACKLLHVVLIILPGTIYRVCPTISAVVQETTINRIGRE